MKRDFGTGRQDQERARTLGIARDCEIGLGEQLKQVGAGRAQPDFDDAVGHRQYLVDRAQCVLELIEAGLAPRPIELAGDVARVDLSPRRPFARLEPEDIAQPVVADVPALGKARLDLAARIEPDEALRGIGEKDVVGFGQRPIHRVDKLRRRLADDEYVDRAGLRPVAARQQRNRCEDHGQSGRTIGKGPHPQRV